MSTDFREYVYDQASARQEEPGVLSEFVARSLESTSNAVVKPLINSALLEPAHSAAKLFDNAASGIGLQTSASELVQPLDVKAAAPFSGEWYFQSVSSGLGALVPYALAGHTAGAVMRRTGAALALEGTAASLMKSQHTAFVVGAFAYDGLRFTRPGETHLGNALGGAAGFAAFGAGNALGAQMKTTGERLVMRAVTGAVGANLQATVSTGISQQRWITKEEALQAGIHGGTMNVLLPTVQDALTRAAVNFNKSRGGAWLDQYLDVEKQNKELAASADARQQVEANPWARVKTGTEEAGFNTARNRIELPDGKRDLSTIGRELHHLNMAGTEEAGFKLSAQLLRQGNTEVAWEAFKQSRVAQESSAHTTQHKIRQQLSGTDVLALDSLAKEMGAWPAPGGVSYEQRWRQEFHQFQQSNGTWRPGTSGITEQAFLPTSAKAVNKPEHLFTAEEVKSLADCKIATELCRELQKDGHIAVFAGGAVRDEAMGLIPHDFDIATSAPPERVHQLFAQKGYNVDEVGKSFGIINLVIDPETQFQIASLRNDGNYTDGRRPDYVRFVASLTEDAARRDLTFNAMFKDPVTNVDYDLNGGKADIAKKEIRTVGDPSQRFAEDKLRMFRVPRFLSRFDGFTVNPETAAAIAKHAPEVATIAPERISQELRGLVKTTNPVKGIDFMMDHGLMEQIMPEVMAMRGPKAMQDPKWHPEGLTWNHVRKVLDNLVQLRGMEGTSKFELFMAGLLHDVDKPTTQKIWPDGGISNHGHAELGAKTAAAIAKRLKFSTAEIERITALISVHMKMHKADELRPGKLATLLENPYIEDMKALQHADAHGTARNDGDAMSKLQFLTEKQRELTAGVQPSQRLFAKPLVDGDVLIGMGLKPSKRLGEIKGAAQDAQREGVFNSHDTARSWLLHNYPELKPLVPTAVSVTPAASVIPDALSGRQN